MKMSSPPALVSDPPPKLADPSMTPPKNTFDAASVATASDSWSAASPKRLLHCATPEVLNFATYASANPALVNNPVPKLTDPYM